MVGSVVVKVLPVPVPVEEVMSVVEVKPVDPVVPVDWERVPER